MDGERTSSTSRCLLLHLGVDGDHLFVESPKGIRGRYFREGFGGVLQVDGYAGYNRLIAPDRAGPEIRLAYCWAHARRKLVEITRTGPVPIAEDGVQRIGDLYRIETEIRGSGPAARLAARQERSAPIVADLESWLTHRRV